MIRESAESVRERREIDVPELPVGIRWNAETGQFEKKGGAGVKTTAEVIKHLEEAKKRNGDRFNAKADRFLAWLKKQIFDESVEKTPDFVYTESAVTLRAKKMEVEYNEIFKARKKKTEKAIITAIGGGDLTDGSCSSLALAYIGNKNGYDVLDYRGGQSMKLFAYDSTIKMLSDFAGVNVKSALASNEIKAVSDLLTNLQDKTKEYYLGVADHAAIVKKIDGRWNYLELQTEDENGWHELTVQSLQRRFGASKRRRNLREIFLYDADELGASPEFKTALGYLNTNSDKQQKGADGYAK